MGSSAEINNKPFLQVILILILCLVSVIIFSALGGFLTIFLYGFNIQDLTDYTNPNTIAGLKLFQLMSAIGLFLIPPLIYAFITSKQPIKKLSLQIFPKAINYLLVIVLMIVSIPFMAWIVEFNTNLVLPDFLSSIEDWMSQTEKNAAKITKAFLTFNGVGSLFYVLLIVAIVPAIGEELLFRGVIQKSIIQWTKNRHWGIWITAFFFSALHMQFYGFLPRMLLGGLFGYLFFWSKSLWLPIIGHFINNGSIVIYSYFDPESVNEMSPNLFESNIINVLAAFVSLMLVIVVLRFFKTVNKEIRDEAINIQNPSMDNSLIDSRSEINKT